MSNASPGTNRISTFVFLVVLAVYALSIVTIGLAIYWYYESPEEIMWIFMALTGIISITLATYVFMQSRRHVTRMKIVPAQVMTTIECKKCETKTVREFQRGDYVYKELEKCPKCDDKQMITAIYKEVKEKEKTYPF
ncbi:MAG TPA: hypothetical protein VF893_04870 [Candidatus Bathyarchaeia archaeon]